MALELKPVEDAATRRSERPGPVPEPVPPAPARDRVLALQRTIGNAATARLLGGAPRRAIQRERDLGKGTPVEFAYELGLCWGVIESMREHPGGVKYRFKDSTSGEIHDVAEVKLKPLKEGDPLVVGTAVKARPWNKEMEGTIEALIPGPTLQFYDVRVEWEEGWQVPVPYTLGDVPERDVFAKDRSEFEASPIKTAPNPTIQQFRPAAQTRTNAAEYVKPGGPIDITSHALGSGAYGVAAPDAGTRREAQKLGPYSTEPIQITNPLVVQNALHGDEVQRLGKRINETAQELANANTVDEGSIALKIKEKAVVLQDLLTRVFGRAGLQVPELAKIGQALTEFFRRYRDSASKFVDQPVTIFLGELCKLGGIYGDADSGLNSYQKGSVAFQPLNSDMPRKVRDKTTHEFVK